MCRILWRGVMPACNRHDISATCMPLRTSALLPRKKPVSGAQLLDTEIGLHVVWVKVTQGGELGESNLLVAMDRYSDGGLKPEVRATNGVDKGRALWNIDRLHLLIGQVIYILGEQPHHIAVRNHQNVVAGTQRRCDVVVPRRHSTQERVV